MINGDGLIILLCLCPLLAPKGSKMAAAAFSLAAGLHHIIPMHRIEGYLYHLTDCIFLYLAAVFIYKSKITNTSTSLFYLCIVGICFTVIGFTNWLTFQSPDINNYLFALLYVLACAIMVLGGFSGHFRTTFRLPTIPFHTASRSNPFCKKDRGPEKARN